MKQSLKQRYGNVGEQWALAEFKARGHEARLISNYFADYDILIDGGLPVEVKLSRTYLRKIRPGYYAPTWCFDTARIKPDHDYLVMLICQDNFNQFYPYLIPSFFVQGRQTIAITSHPKQYRGRWADSLNRWSVIEWLINIRQHYNQQLSFLGTGDNSTKTREWGQKLKRPLGSEILSPFPIGVLP